MEKIRKIWKSIIFGFALIGFVHFFKLTGFKSVLAVILIIGMDLFINVYLIAERFNQRTKKHLEDLELLIEKSKDLSKQIKNLTSKSE